MTDVLVVVVTYNSAHVVGDLLDSLPEAMAGLTWRTVTVDNASTDGTVALLRARGDTDVVVAPNRGYSAGINRGVEAHLGDEPVLILNPDVRMAPGSVPPMLDALSTPGVGIVGPRMLTGDGLVVRSMRREPTLARALGLTFTGRPAFSELVVDPRAYDVRQVAAWAVGAALLVRRDLHELLGGWDESFFLYSEEVDFCLRARDCGWTTVYEPAAVVTHIGGQSGQSARIHAMQVVNRVRFYRRRHHPVAGAAYWLASLASEVSWVARGRRWSRTGMRALLIPSSRPEELGCSDRLVPR